MSTPTKEQVKAFIDDLAIIQHKHGIVLSGSGSFVEHPNCSEIAYYDSKKEQGFEWVRGYTGGPEELVHSIDPRKIDFERQRQEESSPMTHEPLSKEDLDLIRGEHKQPTREEMDAQACPQYEILGGQSVSGRHDGTLNKRALAAMRRVYPKIG